MADQGRGAGEGVSVWGSQFRVDIDFTGAQTAATRLDTTIKNMPATAKAAVTGIIAELTRLEAKLTSVDRLAAGIFGRGGAAAAGAAQAGTAAAAAAASQARSDSTFAAVPAPREAPRANPPPPARDLFDNRSIHPSPRPRLGNDGPVVTRYGPAGPIAPAGWNIVPGTTGGIMYPAYTQGMASAYPHPSARDPYGGVQLAPGQQQRMLESVSFDTSRRGRGGRTRLTSSVGGYYPGAEGYYSGPVQVQYPPGYTPRQERQPGPGWGGGGGRYSMSGPGGYYTGAPGDLVPWQEPIRPTPPASPTRWQPSGASWGPGFAPFMFPRSAGDFFRSYAGASAAIADRAVSPGLRQAFGLPNLMRAASAVYLGQAVGRSVTSIAGGTIGQAAAEQEGRILLAESLAGGDIGLGADEATYLANTLVESQYLVGTGNLSSVGLGLSRADLADQYRQLAPIVRLHAEDEAQFAESLQRGGLARQLLVARDPVQGTRGAMVALSELYAGGPDRFRSLAMRFELPRTRMMELEAMYQAQGGSYDPAMILLDVLTEMGIGPEYVRTRARQTLPGQLARTGAMFNNARIDMFQDALSTTLNNVTRLNDAVEAWTNSDAYDATIEWFDNLFGAVSNLLTTPITNYLSMQAIRFGGGADAQRVATGALDMMERAGQGEFWSMARDEHGGRSILNAAEAFGEAAAAVLEERLGVLASAPVYNPTDSFRVNTGMMTAGGVVGGALLNRIAFGGQGRSAWQAFLRAPAGGRLAAGWGALRPGFMAAGLPLLAIAAGAGAIATGIESSRHRGRLTSLDPSFYEEYLEAQGVDLITRSQLLYQQQRALDVQNRTGLGRAVAWLDGVNPFNPDRYLLGAEEHSAGAVRASLAQDTFARIIALDPTLEGLEGDDLRRGMLARAEAMMAEDPRLAEVFGTPGDRALAVSATMRQREDEEAWGALTLELATHALLADQARIGAGYSIDIGGQTFGFDESQAPDILADTNDFATNLAHSIVTAAIASGESDMLLRELIAEVGYIRTDTAEIADNTSPVIANRFQLSQAPGLFYGYTRDADYRNVGPGSYANPHAGGGAATDGGGPGGSGPAGAASGSTTPGRAGPVTASSDAISGWISDLFGATITSMPGDIYGSNVGGGLEGRSHQGIDYVLSGGVGAPIFSRFTEPVEVIRNDWSAGGLGNRISVRTASGNAYDIGHMAELPNWQAGDIINPGDLIGRQGSTGVSTGPHVHMALMNRDSRNYDEQLFAAALLADFGNIGPLADSSPITSTSTATSVQVDVHLANPANATAEDIGRAVGQELHRRIRDGDFRTIIEDIHYHDARQGRRD